MCVKHKQLCKVCPAVNAPWAVAPGRQRRRQRQNRTGLSPAIRNSSTAPAWDTVQCTCTYATPRNRRARQCQSRRARASRICLVPEPPFGKVNLVGSPRPPFTGDSKLGGRTCARIVQLCAHAVVLVVLRFA
jgi:hypothetical protein